MDMTALLGEAALFIRGNECTTVAAFYRYTALYRDTALLGNPYVSRRVDPVRAPPSFFADKTTRFMCLNAVCV